MLSVPHLAFTVYCAGGSEKLALPVVPQAGSDADACAILPFCPFTRMAMFPPPVHNCFDQATRDPVCTGGGGGTLNSAANLPSTISFGFPNPSITLPEKVPETETESSLVTVMEN